MSYCSSLIGLIMLVMSYSLQLSQWFGSIGEVIFYGILLVTNYRLYRIFYNKKLVQQVSSEACWLFLSSRWSIPPIRSPTFLHSIQLHACSLHSSTKTPICLSIYLSI